MISTMPARPVLAGDAHLPLYRRLCITIAGRIADGHWRPGDMIPSETDLARIYDVAPGTVRKAIETLATDGLIERRHGRGTFVRRSNFDHYMTRFFLFRDASGSELDPESRILSREVVSGPAPVVSALGLPDGSDLIHLVRHRYWEDAPRLLEDIYLPLHRFGPILTCDIEEIGPLLYPAYERLCGELVCFMEEEITIVPASAQDAAVLGLHSADLIVAIDRWAKDAARQPIEWRRSRGETGRFRYKVKVE